MTRYYTRLLIAVGFALSLNLSAFAQKPRQPLTVPDSILLRIVKAEDERRWDSDLQSLFSHASAAVRSRAALAAGRIGNTASVAPLTELLTHETNAQTKAMVAFAIGETEAASGADVLLKVIADSKQKGEVRARAIEALGKIAGAMPKEQEARARELGAAIVAALETEYARRPTDKLAILLGLTATLRAKPTAAGPTVAKFLKHPDARVRADAGNALARLRLKEGNDQLRQLLTTDRDPIVRANAARVLGSTDDKASFEAILDRALNDSDPRVRVSSIRGLGQLADRRAVTPLVKRGVALTDGQSPDAPAMNEALEIATALGRILGGKPDLPAVDWLRKVSGMTNHAPEVETAIAKISPDIYLAMFGDATAAKRKVQETMLLNWRASAGIALGLQQIAATPDTVKNKKELMSAAEALLRAMLDYRNSGLTINTLVAVHSEYAVPEVLRALAAFKPNDTSEILGAQLHERDVIVRGTAADLLGDLIPSEETTRKLTAAFTVALNDSLNDAALSILDSLGKQRSETANETIKSALDAKDPLVRKRAVDILKTNGAGDFSARLGTVPTTNTTADYQRALARARKPVRAEVTTNKGSFTIELLPAEAPLTVDNFIKLAQRNYFNGVTIHRVVPNFVIQDGDPRGDGNGGPGYKIRCEINELPYDRAAVGMALSGKDTGGSQWFVTHSPQPHLDGGYTVFGRVIAGMTVVDSIIRGDVISSIKIR